MPCIGEPNDPTDFKKPPVNPFAGLRIPRAMIFQKIREAAGGYVVRYGTIEEIIIKVFTLFSIY